MAHAQDMKTYFRAIPQFDAAQPDDAMPLAGGWAWFAEVEVLRRGQAPEIIPAKDVDREALALITETRGTVAGLDMADPQVMGILNVTPDSFSAMATWLAPGRVDSPPMSMIVAPCVAIS